MVIKRVLDIGAYGVLIPWVNSKEEAELAVKACKYPPKGIRGYGPRRPAILDLNYYATANDEILVAIQIETEQAVRNLDDILSVPGIDVCYIGPMDLSSNMGLGIPPQWNDARYLAVFDRVLEAAKRHGIPAGMYANNQNIKWAIEKSFRFNTVDDVDSFIIRGAQFALEQARKAMKPH